MMRRFLMAAAFLAAGTTPMVLQAQTAGAPTTTPSTTTPGMTTQATRSSVGQMRAKQLMDRDVYTNDGTEIGEIEDLIIDPASGRIISVVVEVETRLGLTEKHIGIEFNQLRFTQGERRVTINMTRDQVRSLPGIAYND